MSAVILVLFSLARVSTYSVVGGILPPWLESTAAVKKPLAVVRHCSHVLSFGGPCCLGVSRPVPAGGDWSSSSSSGSILPSLFSKLTYTSGDGSGSSGQRMCVLYGIHLRNSHLYRLGRLAAPLFHVLLDSCKFEICKQLVQGIARSNHSTLGGHRDCIL